MLERSWGRKRRKKKKVGVEGRGEKRYGQEEDKVKRRRTLFKDFSCE